MKQIKIPAIEIPAVDIPPILTKMNAVFAEHGFQAYLVGGAVRDMLLQKPASDFDLATDATPQDVCKIFRRVIPTGIEHGTVTVLFQSAQIEVTTFRSESGYSDGRRPDKVTFGSSLEADLARRDFTMNAIAASLSTGEIIDPFGGQTDINQKIIRTVGSARERFLEDGLRPVRAIRFAAALGFEIEGETRNALFSAPDTVAAISIERFRDELTKMLKTPEPSRAFKLLEETGIMGIFLPELLVCRGVEQADCRGFHQFDVLDHLYYACDGAPRENLNVRLAALFHDIGKPQVKKTLTKPDSAGSAGNEENAEQIHTFYSHEEVSRDIAFCALMRLRFPKQTAEYVSHLIAQHMFHYEPSWSNAAVRRFLRRASFPQRDILESVGDLFDLRRADVFGMTREKMARETLAEFYVRIQRVLDEKSALSLKDLAVNGSDLMKEGIPSGKVMGAILSELLEAVTDDPDANTREQLIAIAKKMQQNS